MLKRSRVVHARRSYLEALVGATDAGMRLAAIAGMGGSRIRSPGRICIRWPLIESVPDARLVAGYASGRTVGRCRRGGYSSCMGRAGAGGALPMDLAQTASAFPFQKK
jgi:hypothetical protein